MGGDLFMANTNKLEIEHHRTRTWIAVEGKTFARHIIRLEQPPRKSLLMNWSLDCLSTKATLKNNNLSKNQIFFTKPELAGLKWS